MKPMLLAFAAIIAIAIGADFALENAGFSTNERTMSDTVRLN